MGAEVHRLVGIERRISLNIEALEEMHGQIFVALALRVPDYRKLDRFKISTS